ncbi:MAG: hydroxyacylglutathione hydrolase [Mariprofundaceae bacterium]
MVHQLPVLSDNYIYLIDEPESGLLAAVDPAEFKPVSAWCRTHDRQLTHILNTHHHWDHTGANLELKTVFGCRIIGPAYDAGRIPGIDIEATEESPLQLGNLKSKVLFVPGHTRGHIAYTVDDALFCGDTLFGAGCGRLFEGSPNQMWNSLNKVLQLNKNTRFYCAHEYTVSNLNFALEIDPNNTDIQERLKRANHLRSENKPTVPGTLAEERATNPFLRPLNADFRNSYAMKYALPDDAVSVFAHIRAAKDQW